MVGGDLLVRCTTTVPSSPLQGPSGSDLRARTGCYSVTTTGWLSQGSVQVVARPGQGLGTRSRPIIGDPLMSLGPQFTSVLAGAKTGAPWALEALYRDLQPRLLRYLSSQAPDAAEDLASETWIGVAVSVPSFEGDEDSFRAFLFTVARRRVLDHRRKDYTRRTQPTEPEALEELSPATDGEGAALAHLGTGWALQQIATLPPDQAEVVLLRVIGDLSIDEVASIVGKKPGAVRSMQLRALRRLARQLTAEPVTR